jgi:aspartyl-tRNA(Asn)/glutamyl-tRNA(Gln) amidotransferase subunit B
LVRAHLEEDAGKSLHEDFIGQTGIDLNRAGTPLLEIVTEPDIRSSEEAVAYAKELHKIVTWIGICDGNMQEGSFRCDANVSVRKPGAELGTRREIKNLNSFKNMQQAMDYEIRWQIEQIEDGHEIQQATVLFDPDTGETRSMRSNEDPADYRYFPDPDLPPLVIAPEWVERVRSEMTELPRVMATRFVLQYGLSAPDATQLTQNKAIAQYFENVTQSAIDAVETSMPEIFQTRNVGSYWRPRFAKLASNWIMGEVSRLLRHFDIDIEAIPVSAARLAALIQRVHEGTISNNAAKQIFELLWNVSGDNIADEGALSEVDAIIEARGLKQMNDSGALEKIVDEVMAANAKNVAEFKAGNEKALNGLVGQIMKASKGKANPQQVNALLRAKLG